MKQEVYAERILQSQWLKKKIQLFSVCRTFPLGTSQVNGVN